MRKQWKYICIVTLTLFASVGLVRVVNAQEEVQINTHKLYVPHLSVNRPQAGKYQPLTECSIGFELSQPFPNGTTFAQIGDILGIRTDDIWNAEHNRSRFPESVIDSVTGSSPVCWLGEYAYTTLYLEDADGDEPLNMYFPSGRGHYLTPVVAAGNQQVCNTLSVVFTAAEGTWEGAPIVGLLRRGTSQIIGKIVCNISTVSQGIWSRVAYAYPIGMAATQIYQATTEGLLVPPTLLNEEGTAAIVYYAVELDKLYASCFMDASTQADRMRVPIIRRLYFIGFENAGCIFASEPFYEGQQAISLDILHQNALLLAAYVDVYDQIHERTPSYEEAQEIIQAWEEQINRESSPEPFWVPENNPTECPEVLIPLYVQSALNETEGYVSYVVRHREALGKSKDEVFHLISFISDAKNLLQDLTWEVTYAVPRPRTDGARARMVAQDSLRTWAIDLICHESLVGFAWLNLPTGRAQSGLLRSDRDDVSAFQYR